MSRDNRVACPVRIPQGVLGGVLANAFRIVADNEHEFFLDFLQYDEEQNTAKVVARVRVQEHVLEAIRDRLKNSMGKTEVGEGVTLDEPDKNRMH